MKRKYFLCLLLAICLVKGGLFVSELCDNVFFMSNEEYAWESQALVEQSIQNCDCVE
jgi:hypothetical protein